MFLNHRPLLVLLLFLATSPTDVLSKVLYSNPSDQDASNRTLSVDPLQLDLNPLHILCPVCSLLQFLLGGVFKLALGGGLLKQLGIAACSLGMGAGIHIPVLPNVICAVVFELIFMLTNKAGSGLCPLLLLCPMPKQKTKPTKSPVYSALDEYENHILSIVENRDSSNLSPQMEYLYEELINQLPMETIKSIGVDEQARHVIRNFVAAIQYHLAHREEYLYLSSQNV
ncbi:hypothetical protein CRE_30015 [Caenorhabditis remanei]|uniref:Uncharacterized protein n=1 Tax=Caenorhabditis remanei TaxID=31234 RepID=E3MM71_CAERE|nr:hypothetical protein CRE_30015 [Caenorhabditis remanei]